jgi:hypothetical protein
MVTDSWSELIAPVLGFRPVGVRRMDEVRSPLKWLKISISRFCKLKLRFYVRRLYRHSMAALHSFAQ